MKLSKAQQELYDSMVAGEIVHCMTGINAYHFRNKGSKKCTVTSLALLAKGLIEQYDEDWRGCKLRIKPLPPPPEQNK